MWNSLEPDDNMPATTCSDGDYNYGNSLGDGQGNSKAAGEPQLMGFGDGSGYGDGGGGCDLPAPDCIITYLASVSLISSL